MLGNLINDPFEYKMSVWAYEPCHMCIIKPVENIICSINDKSYDILNENNLNKLKYDNIDMYNEYIIKGLYDFNSEIIDYKNNR